MKIRGKVLVSAGLGVLLSVSTARAGLFAGFDDTLYWIQQIALMKQQIDKAENNLITARAQYEMMTDQYRAVIGKSYWKMAGMNWINFAAKNRFGETTGWGSGNGPVAWQNATIALHNASLFRGTTQQSTLASVELSDSFGSSAVQTLGDCYAQQRQNSSAIQQIESAVLSTAPTANRQNALSSIANAALVQNLRMQQCSQALAYENLKLRTVEEKRNRDADAELLNIASDNDQLVKTTPVMTLGMEKSLQEAEIH